jgi:hypothetical protein
MDWTNPFHMPGRWLKGNLHAHTTRSDGVLDAHERIAAYRDAGYDFIALTDHHVMSDDAAKSTSEFLVIDGVEWHAEGPEPGEMYHVLGLNVPAGLTMANPASLDEIKRTLTEAGALMVLAHPYWSGNTVERVLKAVDGMFALEVFNATCLGIGKGTSRVHWDDALDWGARICGIAVDDAHGTEHDVFKGWVMVRAPSLEAAAVLDALASGAFYSTTGPRIEDVVVDDGRIRVRCSPAVSITFVAQRYRGCRVEPRKGKRLLDARYELRGDERYVRIEVTDAHGGTAWTNPMYFY